jgi:hypothetical protein
MYIYTNPFSNTKFPNQKYWVHIQSILFWSPNWMGILGTEVGQDAETSAAGNHWDECRRVEPWRNPLHGNPQVRDMPGPQVVSIARLEFNNDGDTQHMGFKQLRIHQEPERGRDLAK